MTGYLFAVVCKGKAPAAVPVTTAAVAAMNFRLLVVCIIFF